MKIEKINLDSLYGKSLEELMQNHPEEFYMHVNNLFEKNFTISDSDIEHRTILHWEKEGLISRGHSTEGWRRYSFFDYVWLRTIKELREFGVSIPIIQEIKNQIFHSHAENLINEVTDGEIESIQENVPNPQKITRSEFKEAASQNPFFTAFNIAIFQTIYTRTPTYLIVDSSGIAGIAMMNGLSMDEKINGLMDTISKRSTLFLNISNIIENFFLAEKFSGNTYFKLSPISRKENEIIEILRSEKVSNINIQFKNGGNFYLEIKRKYLSNVDIDKVKGIIAKHDFSTIELEVEHKKIIHYYITEKKIIK